MLKLSIDVEIDGTTARLLLCRAAAQSPEIMNWQFSNIKAVKQVIRQEIRLRGIRNLDGWSDDLEDMEQAAIEGWAMGLKLRFDL